MAIVISGIASTGSLSAFFLAVFIAGIFQMILGFAKAGTIAYYFPTSVIKGMLTAIGIIIILKQIPHFIGYDKDYQGDLLFFPAFKWGEHHFRAYECFWILKHGCFYNRFLFIACHYFMGQI
ncbi:MAG: SulP family inorganic anion transporter [Flavobacteriaceae bacterium]|nr:SulP family inorganic anion transporter [Flavobacteriaceae bacterium]